MNNFHWFLGSQFPVHLDMLRHISAYKPHVENVVHNNFKLLSSFLLLLPLLSLDAVNLLFP